MPYLKSSITKIVGFKKKDIWQTPMSKIIVGKRGIVGSWKVGSTILHDLYTS